MRLFSKIVFICNLCFIASVIMRLVQIGVQKKGDTVVHLPFLEESVVLLGFIVAVLINAAFAFIILYRKSIRKPVNISGFLIWFNLLMLPVEIWYQFIYRY